MSDLPSPAVHLTDQWRNEYLHKLQKWFERHRRDLPWRQTRDPYAIWISESMLQQTQVATVIDYYQRFMQRFPTVEALAQADEQQVMAMWAGLGYYRRARQLHAAAKQIVADHAGHFPAELSAIQQLPGIGRYTAGAIASIALGIAAPIVEANTERLYARLLKLEQPTNQPEAVRQLWHFAQWQLASSPASTPQSTTGSKRNRKSSEKRDPGAINQAVMELGALICKPVQPQCLVCPLLDLCPTAKAGLQHRIPPPKPKREFTPLHHVALMVEYRGRWLLHHNPPGGWWHGLWDFPRVDATELGLRPSVKRSSKSLPQWNDAARHQILRLAHQQLLSQPPSEVFTSMHESLLSLTHGVTRYRITLDGVATNVDRQFFKAKPDWQWVDPCANLDLPLTATAKKMLCSLAKTA
jgi:A/G-specific adenine glycosylase